MAKRLTAWLLSGREVLAKNSGWQADRQMDRQGPMHTDRETETKADRLKDGGIIERGIGWKEDRLPEQQTEWQAQRLPDRHAPLGAGQAFGFGRRHGDSKCLWLQGKARSRHAEIEEERANGMGSVHGWLADC